MASTLPAPAYYVFMVFEPVSLSVSPSLHTRSFTRFSTGIATRGLIDLTVSLALLQPGSQPPPS